MSAREHRAGECGRRVERDREVGPASRAGRRARRRARRRRPSWAALQRDRCGEGAQRHGGQARGVVQDAGRGAGEQPRGQHGAEPALCDPRPPVRRARPEQTADRPAPMLRASRNAAAAPSVAAASVNATPAATPNRTPAAVAVTWPGNITQVEAAAISTNSRARLVPRTPPTPPAATGRGPPPSATARPAAPPAPALRPRGGRGHVDGPGRRAGGASLNVTHRPGAGYAGASCCRESWPDDQHLLASRRRTPAAAPEPRRWRWLPFGDRSRPRRLAKVLAWLAGSAVALVVLDLLGVDVSGWFSDLWDALSGSGSATWSRAGHCRQSRPR